MNSPRRQVVLVGPDSARYRGGIAQFTSRLAAELEHNAALSFISWEELYPRLLISRENSGPGVLPGKAGEPLLRYSHPASWTRAARHIASLNPAKVIFTWSHPVHAPVYLAMLKELRKASSAELIAICHNVLPHENFPGARVLTKACFTRFDRLVVHSISEERRLLSFLPAANSTRAFIPEFKFYAPANRDEHPLPRLLFFGAIRRYKGLDLLLRALPKVREQYPGVKLRIAGEEFYRGKLAEKFLPGKRYRPLELIRELDLESAIEPDIRYIPDEEIPAVFTGVDAAIFPFYSASQSASLSLALAMGVPVVATAVGGFPDVVQSGENGRLVEPGNPQLLANGILKLLASPPSRAAVLASAEKYSWSRYCSLLLTGSGVESERAEAVHG